MHIFCNICNLHTIRIKYVINKFNGNNLMFIVPYIIVIVEE